MLPTLRIYWRKERLKNDKAPVFIIATLKGKRSYFDTGIKVTEKQFADGKIKNHENAQYLNLLIRNKMSELENGYLEQTKFGDIILNKPNEQKSNNQTNENTCIVTFGIQHYQNKINKITEHYLKGVISIIGRFGKIMNYPTFAQLTPELLQQYENKLYSMGLHSNTVQLYLKCIKQLTAKAELELNIQIKTFKIFKCTPYKAPIRHPLTIDQIKAIYNLDLAHKKVLNNVRNAFYISASIGLRYSDLKNFDYAKQVVDNNGTKRVILAMQKTGEAVSIMIIPQLDFLLKNLTTLPSNKHCNVLLKTIGYLANIQGLHFHIARHSFATNALNCGVGIAEVSKLLGHKDVKTTLVYAKIANPGLDKAVNLLFNQQNIV